jgi:type II secretory pathway pseudopilin PulG
MVEVMLVIAIMGVILMVGIPSVFQAVRKSPMRQAVGDLQEACRTARMMAVLQGVTTELVINAQDGSLSVRPARETENETREGDAPPEGDPTPTTPPPAVVANFSAHLPDSIAFKKLVVNLRDMMDYDEARVRFYANGTCDALSATLFSDQNEERNLTLEVTTGREVAEASR